MFLLLYPPDSVEGKKSKQKTWEKVFLVKWNSSGGQRHVLGGQECLEKTLKKFWNFGIFISVFSVWIFSKFLVRKSWGN